MNKEDHFERLLKEETAFFSITPSQSSWRNIHRNIVSRRRFPLFTMAILVAAVIFFPAKLFGPATHDKPTAEAQADSLKYIHDTPQQHSNPE